MKFGERSVLENIPERKLLLKISAGAGLLAILSACGTESADTNTKPSVTSTQEAVAPPKPSESETETTNSDIKDTEILQLTGMTTIAEAKEAVSEFDKLFEGVIDPKALKTTETAYLEAIEGNPKKYINLYSVDKKEFLVLFAAQKSFLRSIEGLEIPQAEADAYAEIEGADFSYDIRIKAAKGNLFLSQYMIEQGIIDTFPKNIETVACAEFGDPTDKVTKYIYASSAGGFFASVTKDSIACNSTNAIYDTFKEFLPDFDEQYPNFAFFYKELKKAEQQAIAQLS